MPVSELETESTQIQGKEFNHWITVRQFCQKFPWPSESALRAYIYRSQELGLSEAFLKVGRRLLVAPSTFFLLIRQRGNQIKKGEYHETAKKRGDY